MAKVSCRKAICARILELARQDPRIWAVCTDSRGSVTIGAMAEELPEQFVELGIAEQNAVAVAAGLALTGKTVFACGPACFLAARAYEQVKVDVAYNCTDVKIIGVSAGVSYGPLGCTHTSLHDFASMRSLPNLEVVTSLAWGRRGKAVYCVEGNINYTGAVITWLVEMGLLEKPSLSGSIAASLSGNGGVYLVPAFSGLGAPYFNDKARAAIIGMDRSTRPAHLVRAAEECIAYQIRDVVESVTEAAGRPLSRLCADGGPTRDRFLMRFQAGLLGMPLLVSETEELSGAGAAYCAAIGAGLVSEEQIFAGLHEREILPEMENTERAKLLRGWREAVAAVAGK